MFKTIFLAAFAVMALAAAPAYALTAGQPAPDFTGTDSTGKTHTLSDYKGKIVVLEWTNPTCPFVRKHYSSHNMQKLQENYTGKNVIWLSVNSSAEGKEGYQTPESANNYIKEQGAHSTARIIDADGKIGKLYDAKTTPHMFVVDKEGKLAYVGAIDDNNSANPDDAATAQNYTADAIDSVMLGKPVEVKQTKPYGCSVKYAE